MLPLDVGASSMVLPSTSFPHFRYSVESLRSCGMVRILGATEGVNRPLTMLPLISGVGAVPRDLDRLDFVRLPRLVPDTSFGFQILMSW